MNNSEMRQERAALVREMVTLSNNSDAHSQNRWRELDAQQEALRVTIEQTERSAEIERELSQVRNAERPSIHSDNGRVHPTNRVAQIRGSKEYAQEFETYIRTGKESEHLIEMRALGAASGADGATLVPQGFEAELEIKLKAIGGMRRLCRTITTSTGNPLPWPNFDDTSNEGEWLTEGSPTTIGTDPTASNVVLGANLVSSKQVKVSVQLEQDSAFDIASMLSDAFAIRIGRTSNKAFTIGDGTDTYGTITGLINALVAAGGRSVLAIGGNNNSGDAGDTDLNSVGTDDLENLIAAVDPAYRDNLKYCAFAANMATWDKLKKLKDKYGRPIWQVSLASGVPDSIHGYKYDYNQNMDTIGAGKKSVVFGSFDKYVIRTVLGFTFVRFSELYMSNYQRGYQAFARMDGKLLQAAAFSYLIHPLS